MKKVIVSLSSLTLLALFVLAACNGGSTAAATETVVSQDSLVKRGNYLVNTIGCDDCHSPKKMGPMGPEVIAEKRFSGHPANEPIGKISQEALQNGFIMLNHSLTAAVGPWGVSYSANITSDETGIGSWSEGQFFKAMREGKYKGMDNSRPMLPPMPWFNFGKLSDFDLKAMFAYLKSTKPVSNVVPAPVPPGPIK